MENTEREYTESESVVEVEEVISTEERALLMEMMPASAWLFLASCYDAAKLGTESVENAYTVKQFLRALVQHPSFQAALAALETKDPTQRRPVQVQHLNGGKKQHRGGKRKRGKGGKRRF